MMRLRPCSPRGACRLVVFTAAAVLAPAAMAAQIPDAALERKIQDRIAGFDGIVGVYARHLDTGAAAAIRADELFPTASLVKVPLLLTLYQKVEDGALDLHDRLAYHDSLFYGGDGDIINKMRPGETVELSKLAFFMISISDNTASLWIQGLVGGGTAVNDWLDEHGFDRTRVNSRTPGREAPYERYGWGQTSPREMAELLVMIRQGRAVSAEASASMYRTLTDIYWDDEALAAIPPHRPGRLQAGRHQRLPLRGPPRQRTRRRLRPRHHHPRAERHELGGRQRGLRPPARPVGHRLPALEQEVVAGRGSPGVSGIGCRDSRMRK